MSKAKYFVVLKYITEPLLISVIVLLSNLIVEKE